VNDLRDHHASRGSRRWKRRRRLVVRDDVPALDVPMGVEGATEATADLPHGVAGTRPDLVHGGADARAHLAQRVPEAVGQRGDDLRVPVEQRDHVAHDGRHVVSDNERVTSALPGCALSTFRRSTVTACGQKV